MLGDEYTPKMVSSMKKNMFHI